MDDGYDGYDDSLENLHVDTGGGRIVTQNPQLLSMLQENTMEKPVRKVYVESPVFSDTDDHRYKYVSGDVDDFDEGQERALHDSATARRSPQYNYKDNIAYKQQRQASREGTQDSERSGHDGMRYEDRNMRSNGYSADKEDLVPDTQYVVKTKGSKHGSRYGSGTSKLSERSQHQFIKPIQSPVKARPHDDEDDDMLLREASYQEKLRMKIQQQTEEADNIHIPKLDLVDSDDERPRRDRRTMDLMLEGTDHLPRDSLDEVDAQGFRDSLDQRPAGAHDPETGVNSNSQMQPRPSYASSMYSDPAAAQQNQLLQQQNMLQQQQLQMLQQQMMQAQQQGQLVQQPVMMQPQPVMMLQNGQYVYQQPQVLQQQPFLLQQQPVMMQQQDIAHQVAHAPAAHQQAAGGDGLPQSAEEEAGAYSEEAYYEQYEQEMQQNLEELPVDENGDLDYPEIKERGIIRPVPMERAPAVDFVGLNKKQLKKEQQQGSYGKKFAKRKSGPAQEESPVPAPRKTVAAKPPAVASAGPVMGAAPQDEDDLTAAEQVWAARAKSLTKQKTDKSSAGKPARAAGAKNNLKRFPSESRVDDMRRPQGGVPQGFRPHNMKPLAPSAAPQPQPQGSIAEPIRSELVLDPSRVGDRPIRHTVLTEDGQKVSVDINLKLVSPTPAGKVIPPLGHQNQQFQQTVQEQRHQPPPPQRPMKAFQDQHHGDDYYPVSPQQYKTPTPVQSPYRVLPPIGSADTDQGRHDQVNFNGVPQRGAQHPHGSPRGENPGSYLEQLHKQKKKTEYKTYTINDYRKMKKEVRLGGLGPDLDSETLRDRKEKQQRQQEYARQANERNKQQPKRSVRGPMEPELHESDDMLHRRKVALEYAKSVPKPKAQKKHPAPTINSAPNRIPAKPASRSSNHSMSSAPDRAALHVLSAGTEREVELIDLQKLQERHERERQQVALIKSNIEQTA